MCGGVHPCKLEGKHPTEVKKTVERNIHCHFDHAKDQHENIKVRNCGEFYIYYLPHFSSGKVCHESYRYCGEDKEVSILRDV